MSLLSQVRRPWIFVFTVCDKAAGEACPVWPGQPMTAHWGVEDPSSVAGTMEARKRAFTNAFMMLNRRMAIFHNLPFDKLDRLSLQRELRHIGLVGNQGHTSAGV